MIEKSVIVFRVLSSKWTIPIVAVLASLFFQFAFANAVYYPLECSNHYSGYCYEDQDCYDKFGDDGLDYLGFCFNVPNYPATFADEVTALQEISNQLEMILSMGIFVSHLIGFWLPFGVIIIFSLIVLYAILQKFGYFRKY